VPDDLDELHHRRRVEEVQGQRTSGVVHPRADVADAEGRRVGGERHSGDDVLELGEQLLLGVEPLHHGLHDQLHAGKRVKRRAGGQPSGLLVGGALRQLAASDRARSALTDLLAAALRAGDAARDQDRLPSTLDDRLGDAGGHRARADDTDAPWRSRVDRRRRFRGRGVARPSERGERPARVPGAQAHGGVDVLRRSEAVPCELRGVVEQGPDQLFGQRGCVCGLGHRRIRTRIYILFPPESGETAVPEDQLALIARYYDACSRGDAEGVTATVTDDVVHFFLAPNVGSAPVRGGEHLGRYWRKVHANIAAVWVVDHGIVQGDEAVIEWSMFWRPPGGAERVVTRGAEWFVLRDDAIAEIRSYYRQEAADTELEGFPYAARGYSTHDAVRSARHEPTLS
jgi:ketosteroid isomerase-like protein